MKKRRTLLVIKYPGAAAEVERYLRMADVSRGQGDRLFQLRAAEVSRACWINRTRGGAQKLLAEIYDWFAAGLDVANLEDLRDVPHQVSN